MRHGKSGRRLNRTASHRKAMFQNMANALIKHEQIITTLPKAKDLRRVVEKLITLGKSNTLHSPISVFSPRDEAMTKKLFDVLWRPLHGAAGRIYAGVESRVQVWRQCADGSN